MGHLLNFGGAGELPAPWQTLNVDDIRKRLQFAGDSVSNILAERVIELVPFLEAFTFLGECYRVLRPGGVLRVSFPDPTGLLSVTVDTGEGAPVYGLGERCSDYMSALRDAPGGLPAGSPRDALMMLLIGWKHQSAWTLYSASASLLAVGFSRVLYRKSGAGRLGEFDGYHKRVGVELAQLDTVYLEATK